MIRGDQLERAIALGIFLADMTERYMPADDARILFDKCERGETSGCQPYMAACWNARAATEAALAFIREHGGDLAHQDGASGSAR